MDKPIIIASMGRGAMIFCGGKIYGDGISKLHFDVTAFQSPELEITADSFEPKGADSVEGFRKLLEKIIDGDCKEKESGVSDSPLESVKKALEKSSFEPAPAIAIEIPEKKELPQEINETIRTICEKIKSRDTLPEIETEMIHALAALVTARVQMAETREFRDEVGTIGYVPPGGHIGPGSSAGNGNGTC